MEKYIENVGEIILDQISLTDTRVGIYIPLISEAENVQRLRKQLEGWLLHEVQMLQREIYFEVGKMKTVPCLYINIGQDEKSGEFEVGYSVVYLGAVEKVNGEEVVYNITDPSPVELELEEKLFINNLVIEKLQEILFPEQKTA